MTYIATPAATTIAIAKACPFIAARSRSSLRLSGEILMRSPRELLRRELFGAVLDGRDAPVGQADDAVGHRGDRRVVRDDDGRGAEVDVDALQRLQHDDAG